MNVKLIFFDMEGTILERYGRHDLKSNVVPSIWQEIAKHLGEKAWEEEKKGHDLWNKKEFRSFIEWMEYTIQVHKKYNLDKKFFYKILDNTKLQKGAKETFRELRKRGYKTCLISGGFKNQADRVQKELKIDHSFAACEYFFDKNGKLEHWNLLPCDYEGKIDFMNLIIKEYKFKKEQCAFVGDGKNDIHLAKQIGLSIAFNGHPDLEKICTYSINQPEGKEDFRAILKFL